MLTTPGQVTTPVLWGACVVVPLMTHLLWRHYVLASVVAAVVAVGLDQVALQVACVSLEGGANPYGLARAAFFFPAVLAFSFVIGLPVVVARRWGRGG